MRTVGGAYLADGVVLMSSGLVDVAAVTSGILKSQRTLGFNR